MFSFFFVLINLMLSLFNGHKSVIKYRINHIYIVERERKREICLYLINMFKDIYFDYNHVFTFNNYNSL
jgi:hypothetical protein